MDYRKKKSELIKRGFLKKERASNLMFKYRFYVLYVCQYPDWLLRCPYPHLKLEWLKMCATCQDVLCKW